MLNQYKCGISYLYQNEHAARPYLLEWERNSFIEKINSWSIVDQGNSTLISHHKGQLGAQRLPHMRGLLKGWATKGLAV